MEKRYLIVQKITSLNPTVSQPSKLTVVSGWEGQSQQHLKIIGVCEFINVKEGRWCFPLSVLLCSVNSSFKNIG